MNKENFERARRRSSTPHNDDVPQFGIPEAVEEKHEESPVPTTIARRMRTLRIDSK